MEVDGVVGAGGGLLLLLLLLEVEGVTAAGLGAGGVVFTAVVDGVEGAVSQENVRIWCFCFVDNGREIERSHEDAFWAMVAQHRRHRHRQHHHQQLFQSNHFRCRGLNNANANPSHPG